MSWEFYTLKNSEKTPFINIAFRWYLKTPGFLRSISVFQEDREGFFNDLSNGNLFIGIKDNEFKAMVYGEEIQKANVPTVEGHLFSDKDVNEDFLTALVTYSKNMSLGLYDQVVTHVLEKHRLLHRIMFKSGFIDTGMKSWMGVYRGKLMEVRYFSAILR